MWKCGINRDPEQVERLLIAMDTLGTRWLCDRGKNWVFIFIQCSILFLSSFVLTVALLSGWCRHGPNGISIVIIGRKGFAQVSRRMVEVSVICMMIDLARKECSTVYSTYLFGACAFSTPGCPGKVCRRATGPSALAEYIFISQSQYHRLYSDGVACLPPEDKRHESKRDLCPLSTWQSRRLWPAAS